MTGKPIQIIHRIIHGDVKETGDQNIATQKFDEKLDKSFEESFLDGIEDAIKKLDVNKNCSDNLFNWIRNNPIGSSIFGVGNALHNGANFGLLNNQLSILGNKYLSSTSFAGQICFFTTKWANTFDFYIDLALQQTMFMFARIDAFRNKLEKILEDFSGNIRDCLLSTLINTRNLLNYRLDSVSDFDSLGSLVTECPCIAKILAALFNIDCADILKNPLAILSCLAAAGIGAQEAACFVNNFTNDLLNNVYDAFNKFQEVIKALMDTLLMPFRLLVKKYCELLTKKINMNWLIKLAKKKSFDCLFIYTLEKDKHGKTYPGMSILDMINTEKMWANCFTEVCSSFSDDLKRKIKKYNEDLRLNFKYWNDPNVTDIFLAALFLKNNNNPPRTTMIRELYSKLRNKNVKAIFTDMMDVFKDIGSISISDIEKECKMNGTNGAVSQDRTDFLNSTTNAIVNSDGLEEEVLSGNGNVLFKLGVEPLLILMLQNIGNAINNEKYSEIFRSFIKWEFNYKKSQQHLNTLNEVNQKFKNSSSFMEETDIRNYNNENPAVVLPTYMINDDYSELDYVSKPLQLANENKISYYSRWFALET
jgi:hypothetical protein